MSEIKYGNLKKKQLYYLQTKTIATRKNVTDTFRIHFRFEIVHAKTTMPIESQRMLHQGGF